MNKLMRRAIAGAVSLMVLPAAVMSYGAEGGPEAASNKPHQSSEVQSSVASVSKVFVTVAAMQLADRGKLDIDQPVTEYLPEFRLADPRYSQITVRMLMDHSSGLMGSYYHDSMLFDSRSPLPHDGFLENISGGRLKADPGEYGAYCNDGFNLLELIVERVSGQDYTDYLEQNICQPLGLDQTGTPRNIFQAKEQMRVFLNNREYAPEYVMNYGDGGVISTARDLSRFGSAFFKGNTELLSENAKKEMATRRSEDPYEEGFGLGWDIVSSEAYEKAGVQILSKGGDLITQHAELLVAPDQMISVGVTSSGGSSTTDTQLAMALMDIALEEQGIKVDRSRPEKKELLGSVPEKYLQYEGVYTDAANIWQLSFPEGRYMEMSCLNNKMEPDIILMYTTEDSFVRILGKPDPETAIQPQESEIIRFAERNGSTYLTKASVTGDEIFGLLSFPETYYAQQLEENPVSPEVQAAWDKRDGKHYYAYGENMASVIYTEAPSMILNIPQGVKGYINDHKITDKDHAVSAAHIPSSSSRDQSDLRMFTENGREFMVMEDMGITYISEDAIPDLTDDISQVKLTTGCAAWYNTQRGMITLDIPENAAVYIYDKRDKLTFSSYMKRSGNTVALPEQGKIVFVGETGGQVGIWR
ncbi:MAG: beta-lactamase family protein [Ruminococcus sp.]|nr:beta-lactamase family protein [Ruminococcus sp.]